MEDYPQKSNAWSQLKAVSVISKSQHSQESSLKCSTRNSQLAAPQLAFLTHPFRIQKYEKNDRGRCKGSGQNKQVSSCNQRPAESFRPGFLKTLFVPLATLFFGTVVREARDASTHHAICILL